MVEKIRVEKRLYQSGEIQKMFGLHKIHITHWVDNGVIVPAIDSNGRGNRKKFNKCNLFELALCKELNKNHYPVRKIKLVIDVIRQHPEWRKEEKLFINHDGIGIEPDEQDPRNLCYLVLDIKKINRGIELMTGEGLGN